MTFHAIKVVPTNRTAEGNGWAYCGVSLGMDSKMRAIEDTTCPKCRKAWLKYHADSLKNMPLDKWSRFVGARHG